LDEAAVLLDANLSVWSMNYPALRSGVCAEVPIIDELRGVWMQCECGDFGAEGVALDVAMGSEASGDAVKVAVVVAGMAAEFEGALGGHGVKDLVEGFAVEVTGG
jgi:hypothetical protein